MHRLELVSSRRFILRLINIMADSGSNNPVHLLGRPPRMIKSQSQGADLTIDGGVDHNIAVQKLPNRIAGMKPRSTVALLKRTEPLKNSSRIGPSSSRKSSSQVDLSVAKNQSTDSNAVTPASASTANSDAVSTASPAEDVVSSNVTEPSVRTARSKSVTQINGKLLGPLPNNSNPSFWLNRKPVIPTSTNVRQQRRSVGSAAKKGAIASIEDFAAALHSGKITRVIVMCGAGISTASGIPDFRTPGTGLYSNLQKYNLPYPEAIFDIDYFYGNPKPFYTLAKELYPSGKYMPNAVHHFFKLLHDQNRLLRIYTQNIDGLERMAGVPPSMIVEAHGTFATATCTSCLTRYAGDEIREDVFAGRIPHCRNSVSCPGVIKPDIVFFGEDLPMKFYSYLKDFIQADALLVLGTSLAVEPFASILNAVRFGVPRVLFNREAVGPFTTRTRPHDFTMLGDLVPNVISFCDMLGWRSQLNTLLETVPSPEELSKRFFTQIEKNKSSGSGGGSRNGQKNPPSRLFGTFTRSGRRPNDTHLPAIGSSGTASADSNRSRPASGSYNSTKAKTGPIRRPFATQRNKTNVNANANGTQPTINRWMWRQDTRLTYQSDSSDTSESSESTESDSDG